MTLNVKPSKVLRLRIGACVIVPICTEKALRFSAYLGSGKPEVRFEWIVWGQIFIHEIACLFGDPISRGDRSGV
jgi:hypothetical protein